VYNAKGLERIWNGKIGKKSEKFNNASIIKKSKKQITNNDRKMEGRNMSYFSALHFSVIEIFAQSAAILFLLAP
jgi:hypothetical protein